MNEAFGAIDAAIQESKKLRSALKRKAAPQVRSAEERSVIKATSLAWFNNHRPAIASRLDRVVLDDIDELYKKILLASDRASTRGAYDEWLKRIPQELSKIRGHIIAPNSQPMHTADDPPDFSPLVSDARMHEILNSRWKECCSCLAADAPLAATVMMGGLLEALLLARVNQESDKSKVFRAKAVPVDRNSGKPLLLKDWTLRHYIDVAHELGWVSQSAKDVGEVLRDYRNFVHPYKQLSHGIKLSRHDAALFWEITKSISRQLVV